MPSRTAYRKGVRHLRLSIHRLEESQVTGDPCRGQTEDGAIVIEGDFQNWVLGLSTKERERERNSITMATKTFSQFFFHSSSSKTAAVRLRKHIKRDIF